MASRLAAGLSNAAPSDAEGASAAVCAGFLQLERLAYIVCDGILPLGSGASTGQGLAGALEALCAVAGGLLQLDQPPSARSAAAYATADGMVLYQLKALIAVSIAVHPNISMVKQHLAKALSPSANSLAWIRLVVDHAAQATAGTLVHACREINEVCCFHHNPLGPPAHCCSCRP